MLLTSIRGGCASPIHAYVTSIEQTHGRREMFVFVVRFHLHDKCPACMHVCIGVLGLLNLLNLSRPWCIVIYV